MRMSFEPDIQYVLGKQDGRIEALERRADAQETTLIAMDGKLDEVLRQIAASTGGKDQMASLAKYGIAFLAAIGSAGGLLVAAFHYVVGKN